MKRLRNLQQEPMGLFVTGEYGDKTKRPHWHALIFNWYPKDAKRWRTNERGDRIDRSDILERTWGHGHCEVGQVTYDSAGYVARYAAKKLVHGHDGSHDYEPISKKSNRNAIGRKWIEKYWPDVFSYGRCVLKDGTEVPIPRYYEKWLKEHRPSDWVDYVTKVKIPKISATEQRSGAIKEEWVNRVKARYLLGKPRPLSPNEIRQIIVEDKFLKLQQYLKL